MRDITIYVFDSRYSVPSVNFGVVCDHATGRVAAETLLADSTFHTAVEVWEDDVILLRLERPVPARREPAPPAPALAAIRHWFFRPRPTTS